MSRLDQVNKLQRGQDLGTMGYSGRELSGSNDPARK